MGVNDTPPTPLPPPLPPPSRAALTHSFVTPREVMSMVELGADHVTLGKPMLQDLCAGSGLAKYAPGQYKTPMAEQLNQPHFQWESWTQTASTDTTKRMEDLAKVDPLSPVMSADWLTASTKIDYLAPGVLDKYNAEDQATAPRLKLSLERFGVAEKESKELIEKLQKQLA